MAEQPQSASKRSEESGDERLETCIGVMVVLLATFLGICNVKAGNIGQKMQKAQVDRNNNWAWYQARNIRQGVYEGTAAEMSLPFPSESDEGRRAREAKALEFLKRAAAQEQKMENQKADALAAEAEYDRLGGQDDQFDLCEAALAIALAMAGVTALLKRWWLFYVSLVPSLFGLLMGAAGFAGISTNVSVVKWLVDLLS